MTPSASPATAPTAAERPAPSVPGVGRRLLRRPAAVTAIVFLAAVIAAVLLAPVIAPYDPLAQDLQNILAPPSAAHPLGTDTLGRDVLSRLLFGGRSTLTGAAEALVVLLLIGVPVGVSCGYFKGAYDAAVMRVVDVLQSIPVIILLLVVLSVFADSESAAMITLGLLGLPGLIRVLRGNTMVLRDTLYVRAARSTGLTELQLVRRHVLPRLVGPVIVQSSLFASSVVLAETGLGYLGFGVQPPAPSWGNMVGEAAGVIDRQAWLLVPSGALIALLVLALGVLGDGLRDASAEAWSGLPAARPARRRRSAGPGREKAGPAETRRDGSERRSGETSAPSERRAPADGALLSVRNLTVAVPLGGELTTVVRDIDLDVLPGQTVGLVGESGCGKTVTAMAVLGLLRGGGRITAGQVLFEGRDLVGLSGRELRAVRGTGIGLIAQDPIGSLDPGFTIGSQLAEVVRLYERCSRGRAKARAVELLSLVRIPEPAAVAARYPHQVSGGMAQRVGIALALAGSPRLLIADEPTTALDVTVQAEILDLLLSLRDEKGMALILVTHDWGVLADVCDEAVVMYAGEVVERSPVDEVFRMPVHPYTTALLESNPASTVRGSRLDAIGGTVPPPGAWPDGCHFQDRCGLVQDVCRTSPVALRPLPDGRSSRCLRHDDAARLRKVSP
ncbi:dipeptide/oligopeptide/nickel ABC transporter permease/ATP-binding protein [Streptomyces muensis]|uniref:Dipeptide/oligopeptide/nickel ABC transporter permease/ATP-binding protein n=1 Tax=Streptomyces muensis TaxID=1077944 RepID=A0A9X1PRQ5_STRM4|nr:dipeptide/oligopeptide/nickel ABC transporter permease/ATP-binding protein [Streptomyces muensis]MCF1592292.1 dipeptide/oligopeptide/nickel ABC transporter permease/ATP-binding protein [Streptomyces muensis]